MSLHGHGGERACVYAIHVRMCRLLCSCNVTYGIFHVKSSGVGCEHVHTIHLDLSPMGIPLSLDNSVRDIMTMAECLHKQIHGVQ